MVRNRVATAAMMPVIHTVMLLIKVGRSATASGAGPAASAGAPAVTSTVMAAAVATARRMRLRYMGGSHLPPQQVGHVAKADRGRHRGRWGAGPWEPCSFTGRRANGVNTTHPADPAPPPISLGGAGNRGWLAGGRRDPAIPCPPRAAVGYPTQHPRRIGHPTDTQLTQLGPRPAAVAAVPGALSTVSPRRPLRARACVADPLGSNRTDPGGLVAQTQNAGRRP